MVFVFFLNKVCSFVVVIFCGLLLLFLKLVLVVLCIFSCRLLKLDRIVVRVFLVVGI